MKLARLIRGKDNFLYYSSNGERATVTESFRPAIVLIPRGKDAFNDELSKVAMRRVYFSANAYEIGESSISEDSVAFPVAFYHVSFPRSYERKERVIINQL